MGTKTDPSKFDCYANALPDEPMFVLLGRDRHAANLVRLWALLRHKEGEDAAKVTEALKCADSMDDYIATRKGIIDQHEPFEKLFLAVTKGTAEHPDGFDGSCDCRMCRSYAI